MQGSDMPGSGAWMPNTGSGLLLAETAKKRVNRFFLALVVYTLVMQVAYVILSIAVELLAPAFAQSSYYIWVLNFAAMYVIAFPVLCAMLLLVPAAQPPERTTMSAGVFLVLFFVAQALMTVGALVGNGLMGVFELLGGGSDNPLDQVLGESALLPTILMTLVVAPVMEELVFRKFLVDRLRPLGDVAVILLSGLAFGLFHGNLFQFFYTFMLGCLLAGVYLRYGNILYTMILHFLVNLFGGVLPLLLQNALDMDAYEQALSSGDDQLMLQFLEENLLPMCGMLLMTLLTYGGALLGIILLIVYRRRFLVGWHPSLLDRNEVRGALLTPGFLIFLILQIVLLLLEVVTPFFA